MIQQIIDQAGLTNVADSTANPARDRAWQLLANDLAAGGWRHPRLQASAVTAPGSNTSAPDIVDVTVIWAAIDPAGQVTERHRSIVRLAWVDDRWQLDRIT